MESHWGWETPQDEISRGLVYEGGQKFVLTVHQLAKIQNP